MKLFPMRSAAFTLCAGLLCAAPAFAQQDAPPPPPAQTDGSMPPPGGPHRGGPEHRLEMLQRSLNLSSDQTAQVSTLLSAERTRMESLHGSTSLSQDDRRAQMMAIHQDTNTKLRALLTPDQVTKYDAMEARMREHRHGGPDGPPPSQQGPSER